MAREPPMHYDVCSTCRCVLVVAGERNSAWRRLVSLSESRFCLEVDQGTTHLMGGGRPKLRWSRENFSS